MRNTHLCGLLIALLVVTSCAPDPQHRYETALRENVEHALEGLGLPPDSWQSRSPATLNGEFRIALVCGPDDVSRIIARFKLQPYASEAQRYLGPDHEGPVATWRTESTYLSGRGRSGSTTRVGPITLHYYQTDAWAELSFVPESEARERPGDDLLRALAEADTATARALLRAGPDLNIPMGGDETLGTKAMSVAYSRCDESMVLELLRAGISPCDCDIGGGSALQSAAAAGDSAAVAVFLEYCRNGEEPCLAAAARWAAIEGSVPVLDLLLKSGIDVNMLIPTIGVAGPQFREVDPHRVVCPETLLMSAARYGHGLTVAYLLDQGARAGLATECSGKFGAVQSNSPLSLATRNGHDAVVSLLTVALSAESERGQRQ